MNIKKCISLRHIYIVSQWPKTDSHLEYLLWYLSLSQGYTPHATELWFSLVSELKQHKSRIILNGLGRA